jgi:hypothetical protein
MNLPPRLENLARAFHPGISGLRTRCKCGRAFYDTQNSYDWEEGELEALISDPTATGVPYTVEIIDLPDGEYAVDCSCWHEKGHKIIGFLDNNQDQIARWFELERERLAAEVASIPVLRTPRNYKPMDTVVALTDITEGPSEDFPLVVHARKGDQLTILEVGGWFDYIVKGHRHQTPFHVRRIEIYPANLPIPE